MEQANGDKLPFPVRDELDDLVEICGREKSLEMWESLFPKTDRQMPNIEMTFGTAGEIPKDDEFIRVFYNPEEA